MDTSFINNSTISITNAVITGTRRDNNSTFVTVNRTDCINCRPSEQTLVLVVNNNTDIFNETGNRIRPSELQAGMVINARVSSAMTRSIPPQTTAFLIRLVRGPVTENVTVGRILQVDNQNRSFTTMGNDGPSSIIRFNISNNTRILDILGNPMPFSRLFPGLRVRVRHASFMTASIPPQTTAFEVRVIR